MQKNSLDRKILTGFIACAVVLITVAVISFNNTSKFTSSAKWVNYTHEVLHEFEEIKAISLEAQASVRGFVISGKENFLEPYYESKRNIFNRIDHLYDLMNNNPQQQANIDTLRQRIIRYMKFQEQCIELRRTDANAAIALVATGTGKLMQDEIRRISNRAINTEKRLLAERQENNQREQDNFTAVFIVLVTVITIVLLVIYLMIAANLRALRKTQKESDDKNWILTGSGLLVKSMEGNQAMNELCQNVINHLTEYTGAPSGLFYVTDRNQTRLELKAGYAIDATKKTGSVISIGEGLAGQAIVNRQRLVVSNISEKDYLITTGFGDIRPRHIVVLPCMIDGKVVGAIELAYIHQPEELLLRYLDSVMNAIAIAIVAAQAREEVKALLEETQRQSEELQAQQEELRQTNEELMEKTEMLEKSEAELKAQQEELQQSNEELEEQANLLEEQKESLENAKADLENKARQLEVTSKFKSEFLANMSHELRTPLNSILILSQLMSENKTGKLGEKEIEFARNIHKSGSDLLSLINEILDLTKIESGKMELDIEKVPVNGIVSNLHAMFDEVARHKAIHFNIKSDPKLNDQYINTDMQRLEQVLKNLLSNAFKFTPKNGQVTLSIAQAPADMRYRNQTLANAGNVISFSVKDTGIGIPENKRAIIFEAFQQADGSTKRKYGGTGLGLSISRELTQAMGGEIHLESEEGKGSTFTLYLPQQFNAELVVPGARVVEIKENTPPAAETPAVSHPPAPADEEVDDDRHLIGDNDRVILILEDEKSFYQVLLDFVRKRKYKGIVATQGNTGLSYARYYKPDAILLDMKLPVMDGMEVLKHLKNDPELRHIPVQIISATDQKKHGMALGAFDYMTKPVTLQDLQQAFDKIEYFTSKKLKKLLVIEDNVEHNRIIRELVGNGDVKSFSAYNGAEAMDILQKDEFDCIILDLGLPDISGFELLEKIKTLPRLNRIPVVVYTGRDLNPQENQRLNKLADTVVLKTVNSTERLLDETALFLHRVEAKLPQEKQHIIRKLHKADEILKDKKVLLVDDDIRNIYSIMNALEMEGVKCLTAENGKQALQVLSKNTDTDLVLLDIMMPEMDGYETIEAIRAKPELAKLPVIALTAKAMKGDREKCLAAGMSDYISKPVNIDQLLSLMRVWLYK